MISASDYKLPVCIPADAQRKPVYSNSVIVSVHLSESQRINHVTDK